MNDKERDPVQVRTKAFKDCIDAIRGAIAFGQQNTNPPPDGEWLAEFWNLGRQFAAPASGEAVSYLADVLRQYDANGIHIGSGLPKETCPCGLCQKVRKFEAAPIAAQEQARGMVGEDEPVYSNGLTFDQIADAADANEALECIEDIEPLLTWCVANVKKWNFPHWDQARKALDKLRSLLAAPLAESLQGDMAGASEPDMSAVTEDRQAVVTAERAIRDNPGTTLSIIRRMQAELDAARATPPAAGADDARERDALRFLTEEDFAVLFQFYSQAEDFEADGYTTRKEDMKRLAEIGAVNSLGFGRYAVTSFGAWLVDTAFHQSPSLPLRTVAEYNADAALRASNQGESNG